MGQTFWSPINLTSLQINLSKFTSKHSSDKKLKSNQYFKKMGLWDKLFDHQSKFNSKLNWVSDAGDTPWTSKSSFDTPLISTLSLYSFFIVSLCPASESESPAVETVHSHIIPCLYLLAVGPSYDITGLSFLMLIAPCGA